MSNFPVLDDYLTLGDNFLTGEDEQRARAQYLEALLAAVLLKYRPSGGALLVDVVEAARTAEVFVDLNDSSTATLVWRTRADDQESL